MHGFFGAHRQGSICHVFSAFGLGKPRFMKQSASLFLFKRTRFVLLFVLLICRLPASPVVQAGEAIHSSPLFRTVKLNLWGTSLGRIAQAIREQAGVEILFYKPDLPPEVTGENTLHIVTGNVTLGAVMEALARSVGFRFRVTASGTVEVSRGYNWVSRRPSLRFVRVAGITSAEESDQVFRDLISEMAKPLMLLAGEFGFKFEPYPLPGRPDAKRGTLVLPDTLADYITRGLACLAGQAGDYPGQGAGRKLFAEARNCEADWARMLSRPIRLMQSGDLRAIFEAAATQTQGVMVFRQQRVQQERGGMSASIERYTLGQLCERLSTEWGLGRRVFLSCGGVVFEGENASGDREKIEMDARSRELFWDGLAVAGFDVRGAVERTRGSDALMTLLRRDVFPGLWRDPMCSMTYSSQYGRMAVIAPGNVMAALEERIRELGGR